MDEFNWSILSKPQVGKYAEYFTKMTFTMYGFDVYTSEVDDKGIDFIIRNAKGKFFEIQVKSLRAEKSGYVYQTKEKFDVNNENLFLALVVFQNGLAPQLFLINSQEWLTPNEVLRNREYIGLKSDPEWGINYSKKNLPVLQKFSFNAMIEKLR